MVSRSRRFPHIFLEHHNLSRNHVGTTWIHTCTHAHTHTHPHSLDLNLRCTGPVVGAIMVMQSSRIAICPRFVRGVEYISLLQSVLSCSVLLWCGSILSSYRLHAEVCFSVVKCSAVRHISFPLTACVCI